MKKYNPIEENPENLVKFGKRVRKIIPIKMKKLLLYLMLFTNILYAQERETNLYELYKDKLISTNSGLKYYKIDSNNFVKPNSGDKINVEVKGYLENGSIFQKLMNIDIVYKETKFIAGFSETLDLLNFDEKIIVYIPSNLAYAEKGVGSIIPPNSNLIFEVKLLTKEDSNKLEIEKQLSEKIKIENDKANNDLVKKSMNFRTDGYYVIELPQIPLANRKLNINIKDYHGWITSMEREAPSFNNRFYYPIKQPLMTIKFYKNGYAHLILNYKFYDGLGIQLSDMKTENDVRLLERQINTIPNSEKSDRINTDNNGVGLSWGTFLYSWNNNEKDFETSLFDNFSIKNNENDLSIKVEHKFKLNRLGQEIIYYLTINDVKFYTSKSVKMTFIQNDKLDEDFLNTKNKEREIAQKELTIQQEKSRLTAIELRKSKILKDDRDGKLYKLALFNDKLWFIEDLKYEGKEYTKSNYSQYKETGLYYKNINIYRNELCPKGFKIPSKEEFDGLPDNYFINYTEFKGIINFDGSGFGEERKRQDTPDNQSKHTAYLTNSTTDTFDGKLMYNNFYNFSYFAIDNSYKRLHNELIYTRYIPCRCVEE